MEESEDPKFLRAKELNKEFQDQSDEPFHDLDGGSMEHTGLNPGPSEGSDPKPEEESEADVRRWLEELEKEDPVMVKAPPADQGLDGDSASPGDRDNMDISSALGQSVEMSGMVDLLRMVGVAPMTAQRVAAN